MSVAEAIEALPYIDVQHDALAVFEDVEQGTVLKEDIWISGYKAGSPSVHGKAKVEFEEGGGSRLTARDGVKIVRQSKANFAISFPSLDLQEVSVRFPKQVAHPPYTKRSSLDPPLTVNSVSCSSKSSHIVVAGPNGYLAVLNTAAGAREESVMLKGHVGDVLDARWFPSGEVVLSCSSDLSIRIFRASDGLNPRTLTGHTRAVTTALPVGIGKEVVSGSKDGSVRVWNVAEGKEVRRWETVGRAAVEAVVLVEDGAGIAALTRDLGSDMTGGEERKVLAVTTEGAVEVWSWSAGSGVKSKRREKGRQAGVGAVAYDPDRAMLALGYTDGVIELRHLATLFDQQLESSPAPAQGTMAGTVPAKGEEGRVKFVRRNESPSFSLAFAPPTDGSSIGADLLMGTAAGLPCRLGVETVDDRIGRVWVKEEYAGWEPVPIEGFAVEAGAKGIWNAGGEAALRRY